MKTEDAITKFITAKKAEGLKDYTIYCYEKRLGLFSVINEDLPIEPEPIEAFLLNPTWTPENKETYWRLLRNMYNFLQSRGHIDFNPIRMIPRPKIPKKDARSFNKDEVQLIFDFMKTDSNFDLETKIFTWVLMDTGVRLSEALSINPKSFSGDGFVLVSGKVGDRIVPISKPCEEATKSVLDWKWHGRDSASKAVKRCLKEAGLEGKRTSPHTLRHTYCREYSGDVSILVNLMGWTSSRMLKVYRPFDKNKALKDYQNNSFTKDFYIE